jgi:polysaccharide export outer membrane protein
MRSILLCLTLGLASLTSARAAEKLTDGDMLQMSLSGAPREYTQEYDLTHTVDEGTINVPNVGRIKIGGLSVSQATTTIEKRLRDEKIFTNPTIVINVLPNNQRAITLGGAVRNPGRQPWSAGMTLSMALAMASGPQEFARDEIRIRRGGQTIEFSRKALKKDPSKEPLIMVGDYIELAGEF